MQNWKRLIIVLLILAASGCGSQAPGGNFLRDGVSFTYPTGWSITEQEEIEGGGYYLSVEKDGFNVSGLLTLTWINGLVDTHEYLETIQAGFEKQKLLNDITFQPVRDNNFNGIPCISSDYKFTTLSVKHIGIIYVFVKGDKTYSIMKQEAIEDVANNKEGFDEIVASFKVE